ncbi:hypothetical protein WG66_002806 [Moniliophthora roreri]|uniref:Uncharacterized protein n=1 Tax=Moniliophthora roreri TaxID=221103 RepID=A0A0W0GA06_MONRR|nr:hypothetical protein WG66_002806 [Moniliophthora roreri]
MRPTSLRLLQILHKTAIKNVPQHHILPPLTTLVQETKKNLIPTVIETLQKRGAKVQDTGASETVPKTQSEWPVNLRIEPTVKKADLKHVDSRIRVRLKELIKRET